MKARAILLWILVVIFLLSSIQSAAALEKQISITDVSLVNGSGTLRVNGTLFVCEGNSCSAYVSYDCPVCPVCPSINYMDLQANISSRIAESQEKIIKSIIEHNSSPDFKRADIEALLADDDEAGKIQDFIQNTVMKKESDFENQSKVINDLKQENRDLNATVYNLQSERDLIEQDRQNTSKWLWTFAAMFVICVALLLLAILGKEGSPLGRISRRLLLSRHGYTPYEAETRKSQEERLTKEGRVKYLEELAKNKEVDDRLSELGHLKLEEGMASKNAGEKLVVEEGLEEQKDPEISNPDNTTIKNMVVKYIRSQPEFRHNLDMIADFLKSNHIPEVDNRNKVSVFAIHARRKIKKEDKGKWDSIEDSNPKEFFWVKEG